MFRDLVEWVTQPACSLQNRAAELSSPGFVHEAVQWDDVTRSLICRQDLHPGTVVMRIPALCSSLSHSMSVSAAGSALRQQYLTQIFGDVHRWTSFHNEPHDVQLAWELALKPKSWKAYLRSLPSTICLPRMHVQEQHSDQNKGLGTMSLYSQRIQSALTGTSVVTRIQRDVVGTSSDYATLVVAHQSYYQVNATEEGDTMCSFMRPESTSQQELQLPSFDDFSYALAIVSSRAFHVPSDDSAKTKLPILVPVLDLCDHCRGLDAKKNLSYTIEVPPNIDGSETKDPIVVCVTAACLVAAGETLRITYGAVSNAVLLVNYGFCLANNVEPDGSSNDVLEFHPTVDKTPSTPSEPILLRTGPKSYTYNCFVTAIQSFYNRDVRVDGCYGEGDDMELTTMEDFLDECDESMDDDDCIDLYQTTTSGDHAVLVDDDDSAAELEALQRFRQRLAQRTNGYKSQVSAALETSCPKDQNIAVHKDGTSPQQHAITMMENYAALLVRSELLTLQFYMWTVDRVAAALSSESKETTRPPHDQSSVVSLSPQDVALIDLQVDELVRVYMEIRHPFK